MFGWLNIWEVNMKVKKENGRYYVNDLDLEEVMANRKYIKKYVKKSIEEYREMINKNKDMIPSVYHNFKGKIEAYETILNKLELRK